MKKCYITGPMRGVPYFNFPAFEEAAKLLENEGFHVFSPNRLDKVWQPDQPVTDNVEEQFAFSTPDQCRVYARRDTHILLNELRAENGDIVFVLPGWQSSTGAIAEIRLAKWVMLPVEELIETANGLERA